MQIPQRLRQRAPVEDYEDYEDYGDPADTPFGDLPEFEDPFARQPYEEKKCPSCGQMIARRSQRCVYCDADLEVPRPAKRRKKKKPTKEEILARRGISDSDLTAGDIAFAVICSGLAFIIAIFHMISGEPKGWKMLLIAVVADLVKAAILVGVRQGMK
jgi:hypothetical protein